MGRPAYKPDDMQRMGVCVLRAAGVVHVAIAKILGIDLSTLERHYAEELENGSAVAIGVLAGALYQRAIAGSDTAAIFWLKTRARWREASDLPIGDTKVAHEYTDDELRTIIADRARRSRGAAEAQQRKEDAKRVRSIPAS